MAYDIARLESALVNADKAGDVEAAKLFANEIRKLRGSGPDADELIRKERTDYDALSLEDKKQLVGLRKSGAIPKINAASTEEASESVSKDMPFYEKAWAGFGSTLPNLGTGLQQIGHDINSAHLGAIKSAIEAVAQNKQKSLSDLIAPQQPKFGNGIIQDAYNRLSSIKDYSDTRGRELKNEVDDSKKREDGLGGWGTTGKIIGNAALSAPLMAVPGANTAIGTTAISGLMGALQPVGTEESRANNIAFSAGGGLFGHGLGRGITKTVGAAAKKIGNIESTVASKAAAEAAAETASARSAAGNAAQNAYRQLEHLRELNAMGLLTQEQKLIASQLEKELAEKAAEKLIPAAAQKSSTATAFKEAIETEAERAAKLATDKLSGKEVKSQIMARLKRYGPAVVGGIIGNSILPGVGTGAGAVAGLYLRPAIRSMVNLSKNPAVQHKLLSPIARANYGLLGDEAFAPALGLLGPTIYTAQ